MWIIDPNAEDDREWLSLLNGELNVAVEFDDSEEARTLAQWLIAAADKNDQWILQRK